MRKRRYPTGSLGLSLLAGAVLLILCACSLFPEAGGTAPESAAKSAAESTGSAAPLPDGFYTVGTMIYAVENGEIVREPGRHSLGTVSYTCEGTTGACTVEAELLPTADGGLLHLRDGQPDPEPGLFDTADGLYYAEAGGLVLRNGDWNGLRFGPDGRYTSGNGTIDAEIDRIVAEVTTPEMTREEKLFACYSFMTVHSQNYIPNNDHVPRGQDCSEWAETYMLRLIEMGGGNCYCYAAEFYYLARRVGWWQARAVSGATARRDVDHGWVEMELDGVVYLFDPRLDGKNYVVKKGLEPGRLYWKTYEESPIAYTPPEQPAAEDKPPDSTGAAR